MFKTKRTKWVIAIFFTFASLIFGEEMERWSSFIPDPTMGRANYLVNNSSNLSAYNSNIGIVQPCLKNPAKFCINESLPNNNLVEIGDRMYSTYKAAGNYLNSGVVGDPLNAARLSTTVFSSALNTAGVGPQTNLAIETADKYRQFTMNQFDNSSRAFSDWQMKNSFDTWKMTGNINALANTVEAGKPNVTFSQLYNWDTRKPLTISQERPIGKWDNNVSRQSFTPTTPWYSPTRIGEWISWKTNPNNFVTVSKFNGNLDGYSIKINETKVGGAYGFDPMTDSYSKTTSISGSRTDRIIGGMLVSDFNSQPSSNIGKILNTPAVSPRTDLSKIPTYTPPVIKPYIPSTPYVPITKPYIPSTPYVPITKPYIPSTPYVPITKPYIPSTLYVPITKPYIPPIKPFNPPIVQPYIPPRTYTPPTRYK